MNPSEPRTGGRLKLALIALLFLAPFAAAWLISFGVPAWQPEGRVNYGTLIEPARPLPALKLSDAAGTPAPEGALRGLWSLIYLGESACSDTCVERLAMSRQVRLALDKNRRRVRRVYLAPDAAALTSAQAALSPQHKDLVFYFDAGAPDARAADFFQPADPEALYLVDPNGNWLMVYRGDVQPKGLYKDLKRLLRFSRIG